MNFNIELKNGQLLKGFIRSPGENPAGVIAFVHGIGEHLGRYNNWSERFSRENFAFIGFDLPGHGKSEGKRGHIKSYSLLYEMIDIMLRTIDQAYPNLPVWLYGHSLGGGIVLDYTLKFNPPVRGVIATSPWLKLAFEPSQIKKLMAAVGKSLVPGMTQSSELITTYLSHDQSVIDLYNSDHLVHDKVSASLFAGAIKSARYSLNNAANLKKPLLIVHGSDDMICSPEGSREFTSKTNLAELRIWDGGFHELHNEPFREDVFRFILDWIRKQK
ncbi:MAG TPA: lysophospholipase [Bacteroidales bacterium]|nr:lysophospholipase [Bacteroidales bacterium]